jgi:transcriptional regulator with XRE-family HTH domain
MLAGARRQRGWSLREAARRADVSPGTIVHLEKARRAPSIVVAERIIDVYRLADTEAGMLRAEAVEGAGWDSPFKEEGYAAASVRGDLASKHLIRMAANG